MSLWQQAIKRVLDIVLSLLGLLLLWPLMLVLVVWIRLDSPDRKSVV